MIEPEEIAKWAELYDQGYRNLDLSSEEASAARRGIDSPRVHFALLVQCELPT